MTIFLGLGAGWLAGGALSGSSDPTLTEGAQVVTQTEQTAPVNSINANSINEAGAVKQAENQPPAMEEQSDKDEPRTRVRRRTGARRVYVTARAGEPVPLAVIKGKPLKKAFRQIKRIW